MVDKTNYSNSVVEATHMLSAQQALYHRAICNLAARRGKYNSLIERKER